MRLTVNRKMVKKSIDIFSQLTLNFFPFNNDGKKLTVGLKNDQT